LKSLIVILILATLGGVVWHFYDGDAHPEEIPWPKFQAKTEDVVQIGAAIHDIELSKDEKLLVVASNKIDFFHLPSREPVEVFPRIGENGSVDRIALSPNGRWLAAHIDRAATDNYRKQLVVFEIGPNKITAHRTVELGHGTSEGLDDLLITHDGAHLMTADAHGRLRVYSLPDLDVEFTVANAHRVPERGWSNVRLAYLPGHRLLASGGGDGFVKLWRWADRKLERVAETSLGYTVTDVVASPDERELFVSTYEYQDTQLLVMTTDGLQTARRLAHRSSDAFVNISVPRRAREVAAGCKDFVLIFDPRGNDNNDLEPEEALMGLFGPVGHFSVMNGPSLITDHLYFDGDSRMITATKHGHLAFYKRLDTEFSKRLWQLLSRPL